MPSTASTPRRRVPRAERERQMLEVADQVFAAHGYHAASMDEIADGVGVSKPMLYAYFGSKEGLYVAVLRTAGDELVLRLLAAAVEPTPRERLAAGALAFFEFVDEHRGGWAVLSTEMTAATGPFAGEVAQIRGRIVRTIAALLQQSDAGPDAEPFAHAVVGAGESLSLWWLTHPDEPADRMADRLLSVVWTGLGRLAGG